jgi:hypothetical protein
VPIKRFLFCALLLLCPPRQIVASAHSQTGVLAAPPSPAAPFDIPSFTAELHRLSALLEKKPAPQTVAALRQSLPAQWTVSTSDSSYSISTDFLRDKLSSGQLDKAQAWLDHLAAQAESYSAARAAPPANAKTELDHILAEDDFAGVRPPTVWERFRQRVVAWLERMFLKLFGGMGRHPIVGQFLFWLVMLVGVSFIAFWLFRLVTRFDRMNALPPTRFVVPSRSWQEWIRLAREAAARNDFREAVHAAYWAGIVRLQETGVLPRDRTKTPREYLRIASQPSLSGIAPNPLYKEPLAALTARLERIWYANRGAGPDDFRDSLRQLEALGCPLE